MKGQVGVEVAEFFGGLIVGCAVLATELFIFASTIVIGVLQVASQQIAATAGAVAPVALPFALMFFVVDALQNFFIGYLAPESFVMGFLAGDLLMILLIGWVAFDIVPSVVIGMVIAFGIALIGLIIRPHN